MSIVRRSAFPGLGIGENIVLKVNGYDDMARLLFVAGDKPTTVELRTYPGLPEVDETPVSVFTLEFEPYAVKPIDLRGVDLAPATPQDRVTTLFVVKGSVSFEVQSIQECEVTHYVALLGEVV